MRIADERLDKLGEYFVRLKIRERYGISFETFVRRVLDGIWKMYVN